MSNFYMNNFLSFSFSICLTFFCLINLKTSTAQSIKGDDMIINQWANSPLKIDGDLGDWGDSLRYYHENTRFSFNIVNNQDVMYVAIKSQDKQNLNRILARGISFSVNTDAKKKEGPTVIFPVVDRRQPVKSTKPQQETKEKRQSDILSGISRINVTGFREILDGSISMTNSYGISAAAGFDNQDNMVLEIAIPLALLEITPEQKVIACSIEINGIKSARTTYDPNRDFRRGMYGNRSMDYGYDRRPAVNKQNLATGFWIKSTLAKQINN